MIYGCPSPGQVNSGSTLRKQDPRFGYPRFLALTITRMTARGWSVMPVQEHSEPKAIERAVRSLEGSLRVGSICDVEFGAVWGWRGREPIRVAGQWRRCKVVSLQGAVVHVQLAP